VDAAKTTDASVDFLSSQRDVVGFVTAFG